eukprot:TRINITY_DN23296_c0_g1_i1.p1 TRINITY_DN23296_c0_g1~~TRINITY_DN23296_c0_g1_i1.p1  ORF type:complete len:587 (+),score=57.71 TRINITY_DN23296_c0_g1_i1:287-2047(+)
MGGGIFADSPTVSSPAALECLSIRPAIELEQNRENSSDCVSSPGTVNVQTTQLQAIETPVTVVSVTEIQATEARLTETLAESINTEHPGVDSPAVGTTPTAPSATEKPSTEKPSLSREVMKQAAQRCIVELSVVSETCNTTAILSVFDEVDATFGSKIGAVLRSRRVYSADHGFTADISRIDMEIDDCIRQLQAPMSMTYDLTPGQKVVVSVATAGIVSTAVLGLAAVGVCAATAVASATAAQLATSWFVSSAAVAAADSAAAVLAGASMLTASGAVANGIHSRKQYKEAKKAYENGPDVKNLMSPGNCASYSKILIALIKSICPAFDYSDLSISELEMCVAEKYRELGAEGVEKFKEEHGTLQKGSAMEVLKRSRALYLIHKLSTLMQNTCFIGVVGKENTGKSTLIRGMAQILGENVNVPDIGLRSHTQKVGGYSFDNGLWMVDFPGSNNVVEGIGSEWQRFRNVPNVCVLLVKFSGDVDRDIVTMYNEVKSGSENTKVLVLLNKVDLTMNEEEDDFPATFFDDCRVKFVEHLHCAEDSIVFCVLKEKNRTADLKEMGVAGVEEVCERILAMSGVVDGRTHFSP